MNQPVKRTSFIKKLFLSLAVLYIAIFIIIILFQGTVFRAFYTRRAINNTIEEIDAVLPLTNEDNISESVLNFSQNTQTTSLIIPTSTINQEIQNLNLSIITVSDDGNFYDIYVPNLVDAFYEIDQTVTGKLFYREANNTYIPINLNVDGSTIVRSRGGRMSMIYNNYLSEIDTSTVYDISGTITDINLFNSATSTSPINPIISNEVLNILSENYTEIRKFDDNSYYYFTTYEATDETNLVFFVNTNVDGIPHILISVYPMSHIDDIVTATTRLNLYTFAIILIILMIVSYIYSKEFSKPLLSINQKTKELSNLNFEDNLIEINSTDEFGELAENINTLSINLKSTLEQLSDQNKQLSSSLEKENENEARRYQFIRGMSHELKTPLSVIQASSEALEKGYYTDKESINKQLKLIQDEVTKTNKMIKNMSLVYKMDNPDYVTEYKDIDLVEVIKQNINQVLLLASNKKISINQKLEHAMIHADQTKIELIISNLINNAIKYTPINETILVETITNKNHVTFKITNYGITIDPSKLEKLFDPFYRVQESRSREDGSTGLGLYIVKQALLQINSTPKVQNVDNGVMFSFTLETIKN